MTFPICSYTFTVFAFKILEISVTKYSRILKEYLFRADVMLFFFFFFYIGKKKNMKKKTSSFFFFFTDCRHIHTHIN